MTTPHASVDDVELELPEGHDIDPGYIEAKLEQAALTVGRRLPNETDETHLAHLEALVAADFIFPRLTDADQGKVVDSVDLGNASKSFDTPDASTGSPFWHRAVRLDERLGDSASISFGGGATSG